MKVVFKNFLILKIQKKFLETIRAIGVSNYTINDLEEILDFGSLKPHVNQCEFHPFYNNDEIRKFCYGENIQFMVSLDLQVSFQACHNRIASQEKDTYRKFLVYVYD